ncbi:hypothetical protein [Arthrobacter crystallopoietes]|uniref:hypothetical protein n=1 Tax=Crystallibacter crystallopoietes TaxID=37928 RepID=UPI0011110DA9|nr:hypothetical protein [Arthrobacter crystallopoietes]
MEPAGSKAAPFSANQRAVLRQILEHAGDLAAILDKQFAASLTVPDPDCPECFGIDVTGGVRLLPENTECPLPFGADPGEGRRRYGAGVA